MSSLSPFANTGLGYGMGIYRPRRPSYTYATQAPRQRTESYRYAVRKSTGDPENTDFIEGMTNSSKRGRKESYFQAVKRDDRNVEMAQVEVRIDPPKPEEEQTIINNRHSLNKLPDEHINELKRAILRRTKSLERENRVPDTYMAPRSVSNDQLNLPAENHCFNKPDTTGTPNSELSSNVPSVILFTFKKNLVFLCISFILLFSVFRAIQNLQTSINDERYLGVTAMSCVHGAMFVTCLWAPVFINLMSAKWAITCGMFSFLAWTGANFYPSFYTLVPTGLFSGWGQGILWTAEASYILKLAFDSSRITKKGIDKEVFRFNGFFLAGFQTTHIWGNLISSIIISSTTADDTGNDDVSGELHPNFTASIQVPSSINKCGGLYPCSPVPGGVMEVSDEQKLPMLWKLMGAYIVIGFVGFCLIFFCLDQIGARVYPEKTGLQIYLQHLNLLVGHKTFRLLIPLLIFSGLQQGFVFADFNMAFVTCSLKLEFVGYTMIVMGVANVCSAVLIGLFANHVPREAVFGIGGVTHIGVMIIMLIWVPDTSNLVHFVIAAVLGLCDAVWQTQCNTLICITCPEAVDIAFANYRMLQSLGLFISFVSDRFMCVYSKLYFLIIMLVVSTMFYVLAEYRVRQIDNIVDEVFEEQTTVNQSRDN
ncbi:protein unc-93 homolog A-like [Saccostrea cucullata]|uniref:protein unc-93 homolog A-like n=1 Tax=Saccostrea cuccullata TaxID=36930 RepID=UPI002ED24CCD